MEKPNPKNVNPREALEWLNNKLRYMKNELGKVDNFFAKNKINPEKIKISQEKLSQMHEICEDFEKSITKYKKTNNLTDLNTAFTIAEMFDPSFEFNYGEIIGNAEEGGYKFDR